MTFSASAPLECQPSKPARHDLTRGLYRCELAREPVLSLFCLRSQVRRVLFST